MRIIACVACCIFFCSVAVAQTTPFEKTKGAESATYFEAIAFYQQLDKASTKVQVKEMGLTDAGYPLHLVLVSNDGQFDPAQWHQKGKAVVMVNNGIHPGEPDGIDASMMLVRDIITGTTKLPDNVCLGIIAVYNIGGSLNRGKYSRANQNGPAEYGFRGNAQNLDLNRDFTKADSYNARSFAKTFHFLNPDILIDNHVSDGADFQHVFTLLTSQYDKLGAPLGSWLRTSFEPSLYKGMDQKGWKIFPYVNFDSYDLSRGMTQFYDPPRYSSGYAALFQTIGFVPETHMLKPYTQRVRSTYDFMRTIMEQSSAMAADLKANRKAALQQVLDAKQWPLAWSANRNQHDSLTFLGYQRDTVISEVTGLPLMQYNRNKPFTGGVKFYSYFQPGKQVTAPAYYAIQQGWHDVIDRLKENNVSMRRLNKDSTLTVTAYSIEEYKTSPRAYEKHYRQTDVKVKATTQTIQLHKGDYIIPVQQAAKRYLLEVLEPTGDDAFFSWNYFDAILQQKEGYSDYRWDDVAAKWLQKNPALRTALEEKKKADSVFAKNSSAILNWVYKNSPYYEPEHMRYPVFRIEQ
ncbi:MAG TPA: M14 family zinc carboxypeptidase [Phnomibacter sp.]|nr:M14 family zinc carboxypeptidase [Phnomibacter sp.]